MDLSLVELCAIAGLLFVVIILFAAMCYFAFRSEMLQEDLDIARVDIDAAEGQLARARDIFVEQEAERMKDNLRSVIGLN